MHRNLSSQESIPKKYTRVSKTAFEEAIQLIIDRRENLSDVAANKETNLFIIDNETGNTLVHEFIKYHDCKDIVSFLVKEIGLDVDHKNDVNLAPVHFAAGGDSLEICKLLEKLKADMELPGGPPEKLCHPVFFAVIQKQEGIAEWFFQHHYSIKDYDQKLFEQVLSHTPNAAHAYLDNFAVDVGGGNYYYTKGEELYGKNKSQGALNLIMSTEDDTKQGQVLSHRAIQRILGVKWDAFAKKRYNWEVFAYGLFVFCFTVPNIFWVDQDNFIDMETQNLQVELIIPIVFKVVTWFLAAYHLLFIERAELSSEGFYEYFTSFWNWINLITYFLIIGTVPLEFIGNMEKVRDFMLALVSVLMWSNILQFAQVYRGLGPMVSLIGKMIRDILKLGFLFLVIQIGFAGGFYYIFHGKDGYKSFFDSWMTVFLFMYGQIQYTDQFYKLEERHAYYGGTFLLICYMVLVTTILYNMLIALMASTYTVVQEASDKEAIRTKTETVLRLEKKLDDSQWRSIFHKVTKKGDIPLQSKARSYGKLNEELENGAEQHRSDIPTIVDGISSGAESEKKVDLNTEIPKMAVEMAEMKESIQEIYTLLAKITQNAK